MSVEFIGTSTELITASHDATARVWDGDKGRCTHVLEGHTGQLNKVRDGGIAATVGLPLPHGRPCLPSFLSAP